MVSAKGQLDELKKPNPRYVLELDTIRGMAQEVDNMDKGLKAVLHRMNVPITPGGVPSASQPPPQLPSMGILPPSTQPANPDPPQRDESAPSLEGETSHREGLFDELRWESWKFEDRIDTH
jgi:hypothetical protein